MQDRGMLKEIQSLASFGIVLVVFGHSYPNLTLGDPGFIQNMYWLRRFIYSFHMPLFMFISGYLFIHTTQRKQSIGFAGFMKKKFVRLLVPYLALSAAAFAEKAAFRHIAWKHTEVSWRTFLHGVAFPLSNMNIFFWFLPTLFLIFLAAPLMHKALCRWRSIPLIAVITVALAALNMLNPFAQVQALNLGGVARLAVYFWMGCLMRAHMPRRIPPAACAAAVAALLPALVFLNRHIIQTGWSPHWGFAAAACGILCSYFFIRLYALLPFDAFAPINGFSYQIYLMSWHFQTAVRVPLYTALGLGFTAVFPVMFVAGLAGPVLVARAVRRCAPAWGVLMGMQDSRRAAPRAE